MPDEVGWEHRRALLHAAHVAPLAGYVAGLNRQQRGFVPDFDPLDGGIGARLLLLLEKPGPRAAPPGGSGFVSRDNPTQTAKAIRDGMAQAGVPRHGTVIWNMVPWWNGTMAVRMAERRAGAEALAALLPLLPALRCAVLAGAVAQACGAPVLAELAVVRCVHPSPNARAGPSSSAAWRELPDVWRQAWEQSLL